MKRRGRSDGANEFQSTLPARGATTSSPASCCRRCHFNPRSPHGERLFINSRKSFASGFQSTLPARGATRTTRLTRCSPTFQSTLPARGATKHRLSYDSQGYISIHAPRTGSDGYRRAWRRRVQAFQSTLPARGATPRQRLHCPRGTDFNPRSPHGERQLPNQAGLAPGKFQSTLPARGATRWRKGGVPQALISIHAPRTGSDHTSARERLRGDHFNPRSPHGERLVCRMVGIKHPDEFQSTLPARGATELQDVCKAGIVISTHAPRTGSDDAWLEKRDWSDISTHAPRTGSDITFQLCRWNQGHFNPRSPHGERPSATARRPPACYFNPRSPHGERRTARGTPLSSRPISTHAPRTGSDILRRRSTACARHFNPRSPHGERHFPAPCASNLVLFQPTLPARGATYPFRETLTCLHISTHAPRTGSDMPVLYSSPPLLISTHAPRTGSDAVDWIAVGV